MLHLQRHRQPHQEKEANAENNKHNDHYDDDDENNDEDLWSLSLDAYNTEKNDLQVDLWESCGSQPRARVTAVSTEGTFRHHLLEELLHWLVTQAPGHFYVASTALS